ncbi:MAG TPA: methyl-accepting chemotaxis protein [Steroidobacteraceae bacterium]|jgi:methyl-accepting chemotaxis protein|nr:methyl-accepting chemotaxis protein [Steroidobacteraceae bacterium]
MQSNQAVTQSEYVVREGALIVSVTDLNGKIVEVSPEFIQTTGFSAEELIGKDHGSMRHPDTPDAVYTDLWRNLHAGRPWSGVMKNRRKNGDYYWDIANATPLHEGGVLSGYMTMRTKPSAQQIREAHELYQKLRDGSEKGLSIRDGRAVRTDWRHSLNPLRKFSAQGRRWLDTGAGVAVLLAAALLLLVPQLPGGVPLRVAIAALLGLRCVLWVTRVLLAARRREAASHDTVAFIRDLADGRFTSSFKTATAHSTGDIQRALLTLRVKMGYQIAEERRKASLLRQALNSASANIMLADENLRVVYTNASVSRLFQNLEADFRKELPAFHADKVIGSYMEVFYRNFDQHRHKLTELREPTTTETRIGGRALRVVTTPVADSDGRRLGTTVEWFDRTPEVRAEEEVNAIVAGALEGELDRRIAIEDKSGFLLVLANGVNQMLDNMVKIIRDVQQAASEVGRAASEISDGNLGLSERTQEQSSALEATAASMEEMTSTVKQNADNASQANQLAAAARNQAEKGGVIVGKAVDAMAEMNVAAQRIADIIGTIDEIAFQTNLLALNAAVEAARAGEQGRGFAVVAAEVRSLASRSAVAAKEIKGLIHDCVRKTGDSSTLVTQSGTTLNDILVSVKKVADIVGEIAAASREQSAGIDQVNEAVMQMDGMTQQNAALIEEASAASGAMAEQANRLVETMSSYRLGSPAGGADPSGRRSKMRFVA